MSLALANALEDLEAMDYDVSGSYDLKSGAYVIEVSACPINLLDGMSKSAIRVLAKLPEIYWIEPSGQQRDGVRGLLFRAWDD